jgi:hypothetical protein
MKTFIIHVTSQTDREQNIIDLIKNYEDVTVVKGTVPTWIEDYFSKAVLGCILSHLKIVEKNINEDSVLVLENDALLLPEHVQSVMSSDIPKDAGILILGGDNIPNYKPQCVDNTIYHEIIPPFYGTQAVWYNTVILKNTKFLLNAYKAMTMHKIGKGGICFESVLMNALVETGLKIYRPAKMLYTTIESVSLRTQSVLKPNTETITTD